MSAQRGLVRKGAAAEPTHVGFLSGVNALVPLEGVELRELLLAEFTTVRPLTYPVPTNSGEAHVRRERAGSLSGAFTCVDLYVLVEGVPLSEASATFLALVRFEAGVDVGVVPQVFFGGEALPAGLTHERLLSLTRRTTTTFAPVSSERRREVNSSYLSATSCDTSTCASE